MKSNVYAVRDLKVCVYYQPFFCSNDFDALRHFHMLKKDPRSFISQHPDDFQIHHIGVYDDQTGQLSSAAPVRMVVDCYAYTPETTEVE